MSQHQTSENNILARLIDDTNSTVTLSYRNIKYRWKYSLFLAPSYIHIHVYRSNDLLARIIYFNCSSHILL